MHIKTLSLCFSVFFSLASASPPTSDDTAAYLEYSRNLSSAARPVAAMISGRFDHLIKTLSRWSPIIAGAASGLAFSSLPVFGWIIGPYTGSLLGATLGSAYDTIRFVVHGVSRPFKNDTRQEFSIAQRGFLNLSDALALVQLDTISMAAVDRVEEYFLTGNTSSEEYKQALKVTYVPAAANLRMFWETYEKVLTVLAGKTMVETVQQMGDRIKMISPGVTHGITDMTTSLVTRAASGMDKLVMILNSNSAKLQEQLSEARSKIAHLNLLDERSRNAQGFLRSTISSIAGRGMRLIWG